MGSREQILNAIKQHKPEELLLEASAFEHTGTINLLASFQAVLESIGGRCTVIDQREDLNGSLLEIIQTNNRYVNGIEGTEGYNLPAAQRAEARELETVHTVVIKGGLGVAENGAVWVTEPNMGHRILPFICQQLVLVVEETAIVATMHDAYEQLAIAREGYGVFIAGPSKTADIEQSLVIGAHGPITMQAFIIKKK
jgi:L-lactate dehydrogenase complex protein LldG